MNTSEFRMPDPVSGTIFEPGVATKATPTDWLKGQGHIKPTTDPLEPEKPAAIDETLKRNRGK